MIGGSRGSSALNASTRPPWRMVQFILDHALDAGPAGTRNGRAASKPPPIRIRVRGLPSPFIVTHHLLAATTSSGDGLKISTTERTRWCCIEIERSHRRSKPCGGSNEHRPSQDCFWFDQCPPAHDPSESHVNLSIAS